MSSHLANPDAKISTRMTARFSTSTLPCYSKLDWVYFSELLTGLLVNRLELKALGSAFIILVMVGGCSTSKKAATEQPQTARTQVDERSRDIALQHFINGSVHESNGEYAEAILEFQDALRYDENDAIYFALAKDYSLLNKHTLAIEAGKKAIGLSPDNLDYRRTLAEIYVRAFEIDSAASQYAQIVQRDSSKIESWYNLARLYQGRTPLKALEVYEAIVSRFGPQWDVLLQMAELNNSLQQYEKAANALRMMTEIDPSNNELKRSLAQAYTRSQQYNKALAVYTGLLELQPDNIEYIAEAAGVYLVRKEYARAAEMFEGILAQDSVVVDAKLRIGEIYFGQMEKDSTLVPLARSIFQRIRDKHSEDWRPYWFLGAIAALSKEETLAVENFRKVTELASWNADGWVYLSSVFLEKNNFEEVATILEAAVKAVPEDFRVNFFLGVALNRLGKNEEAARSLEKSREINGADMGALSQLALVYDSMKKFDESDRLYEEGLKKEPDNHLLLNNYAYSLAERNLQVNRALAMAKEAVSAQPENPSYLDTIGWIYFKLGEYEQAEKNISKAVAQGDVSAVVHEHLGDVYYMLRDAERALEQWNISLKIDSSNQELKAKIDRGRL